MKTLDLHLTVDFLEDEEQAKKIVSAIANAVYTVDGVTHGPNYSYSVEDTYTGPGRSEEEAARAAAEGRR